MATPRGLVQWAAPAAIVLLGGCTTLGPDFQSTAGALAARLARRRVAHAADEAPRRAPPRDDSWWRQFDDPVLDQTGGRGPNG
jgi:predicted aminopeptidase